MAPHSDPVLKRSPCRVRRLRRCSSWISLEPSSKRLKISNQGDYSNFHSSFGDHQAQLSSQDQHEINTFTPTCKVSAQPIITLSTPSQVQGITESNQSNFRRKLKPDMRLGKATVQSNLFPTHSTPIQGFDSSVVGLRRSKLTPIKRCWKANIQRKLFKELNSSELAAVTMGRGSFGRVFSASVDNYDLAVKMCPKSPCTCRGERNSLKLNHVNIVRTHDIIELNPKDLNLFFSDSYLSNFNSVSLFKSCGLQMIVMDNAGSTSLEQILRDPQETIPRQRRDHLLYQISSGLAYCHERSIIHLDLKPANIVISSGDVCKLVDFGSSIRSEEGHVHRDSLRWEKPPGTVPYTAPEIFRGEIPTDRSDIYSFGIIMWQLVSRKPPFAGEIPQVIIFKVCRGVRPAFEEAKSLEQSNYIRTADCCWKSDPKVRPTADELSHRFASISPDTGYESITT